MTAAVVFGITLAQVDELIDQADKLSAICDLVMCAAPGEEMRISRNSFAALLCDPVYKVRDIAMSARKVDAQVSLG